MTPIVPGAAIALITIAAQASPIGEFPEGFTTADLPTNGITLPGSWA